MKKYIYQKFLLQCEYDEISIKDMLNYSDSLDFVPSLGEKNTIFYINNSIIRKVYLSEIDKNIDTNDDWIKFVDSLEGINKLIIINDTPKSENKIIADYRNSTLQAYIYRLKKEANGLEIYYKNE